ncbi:MAG TPA: TRAP transporter large permease subunit [Limnochordia bacterium]|nr:TRAP transporter large permease subunit [Limnochordia bacterium]
MILSIELITLLAMIISFLILVAVLKLPAAIATTGSGILGLIISGNLGNVRHLVEGAFGYFDVMLIIAVAMVFMNALEKSGILKEISTRMVRRFGGKIVPLTLVSMFLVMVPGMLTGSSTAAALTTGRFMLPVLIGAGFSRSKAAAMVAIGSLLGMVAPPVNVPVMLIGSGIDMPYVGFDLPLLILTVPLAVLLSFWFAFSVKAPSATTSVTEEQASLEIPGFKVYIPLLVVLGLMVLSRLSVGMYLDIGIPLMFVVGTVTALFCGKRIRIWDTIVGGVGSTLPVMGILVGAGVFVQVMTLAGVRGLIVTTALDIPSSWLVLAAAISMPLFGAISVYASSSVMGVPIVLALLGNNEIVTAASLSLMAGIGDLLPPIAIVPSLVTHSIDPSPEFRRETIKQCVIPGAICLLWGLVVLYYAVPIGRFVGL